MDHFAVLSQTIWRDTWRTPGTRYSPAGRYLQRHDWTVDWVGPVVGLVSTMSEPWRHMGK